MQRHPSTTMKSTLLQIAGNMMLSFNTLFAAWRFLARRAFKIYPAFYTFTAISLIVWTLHGKAVSRRNLVGELFFLQNYVGRAWEHTWSLAVEEHFYIVLSMFFGIAFSFFRNHPTRLAFVVTTAATLLVTCCQLRLTLREIPFNFDIHQFPTHLRIDSLFLGVLLSYFWSMHRPVFQLVQSSQVRYAGLLIGMLLLSPAFLLPVEHSVWIRTYGFTQFSIASCFLVISCLYIDVSHSWIVHAATYLGSRSYSIYLWHNAMKFWPGLFIHRYLNYEFSPLQSIVAYLVASVAAGELSFRFIEQPCLMLRSKWLPTQRILLKQTTMDDDVESTFQIRH